MLGRSRTSAGTWSSTTARRRAATSPCTCARPPSSTAWTSSTPACSGDTLRQLAVPSQISLAEKCAAPSHRVYRTLLGLASPGERHGQ